MLEMERPPGFHKYVLFCLEFSRYQLYDSLLDYANALCKNA